MPCPTPSLIQDATPQARLLWPELAEALDGIPSTSCKRRGACCALLPQMTLTEATRLWARLEALPEAEQTRIRVRLVEYFFMNPLRIMGCPLAGDGACLVYADRPFGCRAYGLWSRWEYRRQVELGLPAKRQLLQAWSAIGVTLPRAVVEHRPSYCRNVQVVSGPPVDDYMLKSIGRLVHALDDRLGTAADRFAETYFRDLGFVAAAGILGDETALRKKVAVVREYQELGCSPSLDDILARAGQ